MGAKQSKRSVDISGKEAEGAGEVAAGAGGEGRVEPLADADALKPQLNGDAHIHEMTVRLYSGNTLHTVDWAPSIPLRYREYVDQASFLKTWIVHLLSRPGDVREHS